MITPHLKKTIRQFFLVLGLMTVGLLIVNMFSIPVALGGLINPGDEPEAIGALGGGGDVRALVLKIINFFLGFLGLLAVIMVIYGGFLYISSAGNQEKVDSAKKILLYAVIGIVIIIISFALINTLLGGLARGSDVPGGGAA